MLDEFFVIDVTSNDVNRNSESQNFTGMDEPVEFRVKSPDPNVYIPIFEDRTIGDQDITLNSLTKSFSKVGQILSGIAP